MEIKILNRTLILMSMLAFLASCKTIQSVSSSIKTNASKLTGPKQSSVNGKSILTTDQNDKIEFLDNISVTPGKVFLKKASGGMDVEKVNNTSAAYDVMPANLSDVEKANWLQLKYSIKMDVAVETINNIPLLKKIDEWWGTPYCMGGSSKGCVDCSYFTMDVMSNIYNTSLKRTAAEQYEQSSKINWDQLKEGDLIFFKTEGRRSISHVGIYLTNNKFVHASTSQGVTISDLADPYWQRRLYSLGRVSPDTK